MKKNDVFTFTAPNGVEVTGVVLDSLCIEGDCVYTWATDKYLCYAQNRLFWYYVKYKVSKKAETEVKILIDYCILPEYDELLARYNDLEVAQAETQSGM